jgi:hypothetical protein
MLSKFIFVMSIITNEGDLSMKAYDIDQCPDKPTFAAEMNKMKTDGQLINWQAICIDRGAKNEEISYDE